MSNTGFGGSAPLTETVDEPDVAEQLRTRLRRVGFLEIEDSELRGADAYVAGDRIAHVRDETVFLRPDGTTEQPSTTQVGSTPEGAMPRTRMGTPRYEVGGKSRLTRNRAAMFAAGGLVVASVGGILSVWQYRQRQRRRRVDARVRSWLDSVGRGVSERDPRAIGGVGIGSLLLLAMLRRMPVRRPETAQRTPRSGEDPNGGVTAVRVRMSTRTALGAVGALLLIVFALLRREGRRQDKPT